MSHRNASQMVSRPKAEERKSEHADVVAAFFSASLLFQAVEGRTSRVGFVSQGGDGRSSSRRACSRRGFLLHAKDDRYIGKCRVAERWQAAEHKARQRTESPDQKDFSLKWRAERRHLVISRRRTCVVHGALQSHIP